MVNSEPAVLISGIRSHLETKILPFWENLKDDAFGGYYGYMDEALHLNRKADKGCILNSRILRFFSTAATVLKRPDLRVYADHAYRFLDRFGDPENGGLFWSVTYDGTPADTTKWTGPVPCSASSSANAGTRAATWRLKRRISHPKAMKS